MTTYPPLVALAVPGTGRLPQEAREKLIRASQAKGSELVRQVAIDSAIDSVKLNWPSFFRFTPLEV